MRKCRMEEDGWVEDAKLPNPIAKPSVLVINNRIICVGGIISTGLQFFSFIKNSRFARSIR